MPSRRSSGATRPVTCTRFSTWDAARDRTPSERGYRVTGVDRSAAMLAEARAKAVTRTAGTAGVAPDFVEGDVRTVRTGRTYDAVVMLFAVLGYQTGNDDVAAALQTAREQLRLGGVFICDVWFGPAVLAEKPSERTKVMHHDGTTITRTARGQLDVLRHTCRVDYHTTRTNAGRVIDQADETHLMRYFFPLELEAAFVAAGLQLCALSPFENLDAVAGLGTWNVWACAHR